MSPTMYFSFGFISIVLLSISPTSAKHGPFPSNVLQKQARCLAIPYEMKVKKEGCLEQKVQTHLCAGSCLSVFIPQPASADLGICSICQPKKQIKRKITLLCNQKGRLKKSEEKVSVVESCGCYVKQRPCKRI